MPASADRRLFIVVLVGMACWGTGLSAQEPTLRSQAVLDLNFDEAEGTAEDRAVAGTVNDAAQPINGPERVSSPFWNVRNGQAVKFDAGRKQFFQAADSADLDHSAGSTVSYFFLNLHELTDTAFHGIVAKRSDNKANYGFNYQPSSKRLQVYVNDGSGYKVATFPIDQAFGVRRLVHLTATFRQADAPEPDADNDADDLEIRLYVNGKHLKPADSPGGTIADNAGWFTDYNFAALPNDAPLTIGGSYPNGEPVSGLIDELLVFNRPLSPEEAAKLFVEVAGPDAEKLASLETQPSPSALPVIMNIAPRGLQIGAVTRLTIAGRNLGPDATLLLTGLPNPESLQIAIKEVTAERIIAEVTVAEQASPTLVPLAVRTAQGVSLPVALPIDRLSQKMLAGLTEGEPVSLPAAYSGTLSAEETVQLTIDGKSGQPLLAEVELKRLGGKADPVLELKDDSGKPVSIAWGEVVHGGDARLTATLPKDGRYTLELHDLAFKAARSPFRLLVGDLRIIDAVLPFSTEVGTDRTGRAVGPGIEGQPVQFVTTEGPMAAIAGPAVSAAQAVLPAVPVSDGREFGEQDVDAAAIDLAPVGKQPTYVTGQLAGRGEVDSLKFHVAPGQELEIRVDARSLGSPVEPVVTIREQEKTIGQAASTPGSGTATLKVTPQSPDGNIEVRITDRLRGEGGGRLYRLRIAPAGTPALRATLLDPSVLLPQVGRGVVRFRIESSGPIAAVKLIPDEASGLTFEPNVIPVTGAATEAFVTVAAVPGKQIADSLSIVAEAETPDGVIRRPVNMAPGGNVASYDPSRPWYRAPLSTSPPAPTVELVRLPAAAFKGVTETVGMKLGGDVPEGYTVRFSLVSNEPARRNDPNNAAAGNKPLVRLASDMAIPPGTSDVVIPLLTPADVAAGEISAVVKAEIVPHIWSSRVAAVGYSAPFKFAVQEAIRELASAGPTALKPGENTLSITMKRQPGFAQPFRLELRGLPEGFMAPAITLAPEITEAVVAFKVTVPEGTAPAPLPNVELVALASDGTLLKSVKPLPLEVKP